MNKRILVWTIIAAFVVICMTTDLLTAIFALLVMGIVPGVNWNIPAWLMLITYPLGFFLLLRCISRQPLFIRTNAHTEKVARKLARKRVTKTVKKTARKAQKLETTRRRYRSAV